MHEDSADRSGIGTTPRRVPWHDSIMRSGPHRRDFLHDQSSPSYFGSLIIAVKPRQPVSHGIRTTGERHGVTRFGLWFVNTWSFNPAIGKEASDDQENGQRRSKDRSARRERCETSRHRQNRAHELVPRARAGVGLAVCAAKFTRHEARNYLCYTPRVGRRTDLIVHEA